MPAPELRARLHTELAARQLANPRYSIRAFATSLDTDHSTLSQILLGRRRPTTIQVSAWGAKLGLDPEEIVVYTHAGRPPRIQTPDHERRLREWTAEATELMTHPVHWDLLQRCRHPAFSPDCRTLAAELGATIDDVQNALARLLRLRLIALQPAGAWTDLTANDALTASAFRQLALRRIRECAGISPAGLPRDAESLSFAQR